MDTATIMWGMLFGAIGMGYAIYGKKQTHTAALVAGIGLMLFPYVVSNPYFIVLIGIVLMAAPFFIQF